MSRIGTRRSRFAALVLILSAFVGAAYAQSQSILQQVLSRGTLRIGVIAGPYSNIRPDGSLEGYDIDIANSLAASLKVKPEFVVTDIPGRVASLLTRKVDVVIASFGRSVERATVVAFTDPYVRADLRLLVRQSSSSKTIQDFNNPEMTIAIARGGLAEAAIPQALPKAKIARFNSEPDELDALMSGHADAVAESTLWNLQMINKRPGDLRQIDGYISRQEQSIALPAGDVDWYRVLNYWVENFNETGDNQKLFKKWFGFDQPPIKVPY